MDEKSGQLLEEALKDLHKNETFERALGRILRRHGEGYEEYTRIISAVRNRARRDDVDLLEAARREVSDT